MLKHVNAPSRRLTRRTVAFGGLDRTDGAGEGSFSHQQGLSPARYPCLSPARSEVLEPVEGGQGLFCWDGHRILAAGGQLWYDGEPLCDVTEGEKQFAVVNTRLVVWPDKLAVDRKALTVSKLDAAALNRGQAAFTERTVSLVPEVVYDQTEPKYKSYSSQVPWLWTYTAVSWSEEEGWTLEGGKWLRADRAEGAYCVPAATATDSGWSVSHPAAVFATSAPSTPGTADNAVGFYTKITETVEYEQTASSYSCKLSAQVFWAQMGGVPLEQVFRVGDAVNVSGTAYGAFDVEGAIIRHIHPDTNTLTFDPGTFPEGQGVYRLTKAVSGNVCAVLSDETTTHRCKATSFTAQAGQLVVLDVNAKLLRLYDGSGTPVQDWTVTSVTSTSGLTVLNMENAAVTLRQVEVARTVPELDYICYHDNRLWGVSGREQCIYASALGDPFNFHVYDGLATDSFTVAVGSQGPFTGICSYGGAVLCWKEQGLHKVLGTLPENYQIASYTFAGVGRDSHKSLVSVEERLYYLGRDGVYVYTGGAPARISRTLGLKAYSNGVAGTDGKYYYLSAQRAGHGPELLVYDPRTGLWYRRGEHRAVDMSRGADGLCLLDEAGIHALEAGSGYEDFEGVLAPMYEDLDRVQYSALRLRCELGPGAWLQVDTRRDGGVWRQAGLLHGTGHRVAELRLPLGRCAVLEVRLRGHGDCVVLELCREYRRRGRG